MVVTMNEHARLSRPQQPPTTQAAEGLPRRSWTVAEIEAMQAAGIIEEDERLELIGGEIVPMSPKGARHELVKGELNRHLQRIAADDLSIVPETTLRFDEKSFVEPDFCAFPRAMQPGDMRGHDVLLAIEIADASLTYDRGRKIAIYAAFGVAEVWVINAHTLVTHVHKQLGTDGYLLREDHPATETISAGHVPSVSMCLASLGLTPS